MNSIGLFVVGVALSLTAAADIGGLMQKKYPGVANAPADILVVGKTQTRIAPIVSPRSKKANVMPYVIVSDELYRNEISRYPGYAGEPENLVRIRGKKTLVLKASDIVINAKQPSPFFLVYPGIANKPANYIVIDGVTTALVKKSEYTAYMKGSVGVADLPSNYVMENGSVVQVIPVDDVEYAPLFFHEVAPQPGAKPKFFVNPNAVYEGVVNKPAPNVVSDQKVGATSETNAAAAH